MRHLGLCHGENNNPLLKPEVFSLSQFLHEKSACRASKLWELGKKPKHKPTDISFLLARTIPTAD